MLRLLLQEFDFLLTRFSIILALLVDNGLYRLNLGLLLKNALLLLLLAFLKLSLLGGQLSSAMLGLQLLAHSKSHRAVVQGLVGLNVRVDVPLHAQEKKSALVHVQRDLTDDLLEALLEEFLAHRADALFTSLPLHKLLVEHLS